MSANASDIRPSTVVLREGVCTLPARAGVFQVILYSADGDDKEHVAMVVGDVSNRDNVLVRIHSECFTGDVMGSVRCDCREQLERGLAMISQAGAGVVVYLRQEGRGIGLAAKLAAYNLQDAGLDTVEANVALGRGIDEREYSVAALILKDLEINSVKLITNNPLKVNGLTSLGVPVSGRVALDPNVLSEHNLRYLRTKQSRMGHTVTLPAKPNAADLMHSTNESDDDDGASAAQALKTFPKIAIPNIRSSQGTSANGLSRPIVTLSFAQSLDGCIAARPGQPLTLSGRRSMEMTHSLRAAHDAILVGVGTVLADNPRLSVRLVPGESPQPIILDSQLRTPPTSRLFRIRRGEKRPLVFTTKAGLKNQDAFNALTRNGAEVIAVDTDPESDSVSIEAALDVLASRGVRHVMVEGGARVITSCITHKVVDRLVLTVAPILVGGVHAVGDAVAISGNMPRVDITNHQWLGPDLVLSGVPVWEGSGGMSVEECAALVTPVESDPIMARL